MSLLKNFKQSTGKGAMVGLVVGSAVGVVAAGVVLRQHQKTLDLHNRAIMLNTQAIMMLGTTVTKQKSNIA